MKLKKYVYLHLDGCGSPAFSLTYKPKHGEIMRSDGAFHLDGRPIAGGDAMACDSCGEPITPRLHFVMLSRIYMEDQGVVQ